MSANELMDLVDKGRLELTLKTRENIIRGLTSKNAIPEAPEDRDLLMKALDGMDRTVLTKAKIKSDDTAAQTQVASARLVAQLLMNVESQRKVNSQRDIDNVELPAIELVEGESFIGVQAIKRSDLGE